jgi:hypothetical protein
MRCIASASKLINENFRTLIKRRHVRYTHIQIQRMLSILVISVHKETHLVEELVPGPVHSSPNESSLVQSAVRTSSGLGGLTSRHRDDSPACSDIPCDNVCARAGMPCEDELVCDEPLRCSAIGVPVIEIRNYGDIDLCFRLYATNLSCFRL